MFAPLRNRGVDPMRPLKLGAVALALALGGCSALPHPDRTTDAPTDIRLQSLRQPINPPEIIARSGAEVDVEVARLSPGGVREDLLQTLRENDRTKRVDAPQSPFFIESAIGRAYLATGVAHLEGRALAQGWPTESCPAFGAALSAPDRPSAAREALGRCLKDLPKGADRSCGCRLIALDDVLLAKPEAFVYARGVATLVYHPASGRSATLVAEERHPRDINAEIQQTLDPETLYALSHGARRLWLLSPGRPAAAFDMAANGDAALIFVEGPADALLPGRRLTGEWRPEGFRRGRLAGVAGLTDESGDRFVVLFGYAPSELEARRGELIEKARRLGG